MSMTDQQVVEAAERMARTLLSEFGYETSEPSIRKSQNPRAVSGVPWKRCLIPTTALTSSPRWIAWTTTSWQRTARLNSGHSVCW